ncbi:MAG: alpha/beta fold hydrolase [Anaerolineales bacterium]|nr:alpha/beta fold hydrolase [Anaerolineales bacterium]
MNAPLDPQAPGRYVTIDDTRLYIVERGEGFPLFILHGGPGLDHHVFGDYLDPLSDQFRLIFVDQRSQGLSDPTPESTWTLEQMAADVSSLANSLNIKHYALLGHSYGALVALQHAVDSPGDASMTIISSGFPSTRYLYHVQHNLETFEPESLRAQVASSWEREASAETEEDVASLLHDQMPFHFADPLDPQIEDYEHRCSGTRYSPAVLRHFAVQEYGGIEVEDRLSDITQPVLVLGGRHDRVCSVPAAEAMAEGIPNAKLVIFEQSGHMTLVEENEHYLAIVRRFIEEHL